MPGLRREPGRHPARSRRRPRPRWARPPRPPRRPRGQRRASPRSRRRRGPARRTRPRTARAARRTPASSIAPKKRPYAARSASKASSALVGAPSRKKTVRSEPTRVIPTATPAVAAASRSPTSRRAPVASRASYRSGAEQPEGGDAGGHRQRVPRERAGLVDGPDGRDEVHEVGPAAVGADRHPAADDLAEDRQVGADAVAALGAAGADPEPGDHLVEDRAARRPRRSARGAARRKPAAGGITPALATTGSTMTAAIRPGWAANAASTAAGSLKGTTIVAAAVCAGTPALPGMASVATPEPASTSSPSLWPW